jgi:hypothetical protein
MTRDGTLNIGAGWEHVPVYGYLVSRGGVNGVQASWTFLDAWFPGYDGYTALLRRYGQR